MKNCFPHFIYGKIIRDGIDYSGFSIIAKSKNAQDSIVQSILPQISIGQILKWENFVETFTLAQDRNSRAFAYTFKSKVIDTKRGYFPVQHCLLFEDEIPQNLVKVAGEFAFASASYDYAFSDSTIIDPLCLNPTSKYNDFSWDVVSENKNTVLYILDNLFNSRPVVVVTKENDPLFRLTIANAVWLLLPAPLQKQFSFHTNFFGQPDKIKTLLKFTDSAIFDSGNHTVLDLRRGDEVLTTLRDIRSDYVKYIYQLVIDDQISMQKLSTHCAELVTEEHGQFTLSYAKTAGEALKDKIEIPTFLSRIKQRSPDLKFDEVLVFFRRPKISSDNEIVKLIWTYLCESKDQDSINTFITTNFHFAESILISNNENLIISWLNHLIDKKDDKSLYTYLNIPDFLNKYPDLIPFILSVFVQVKEDFNEKQIELLLENGLKSKNLDQYINIVLSAKGGLARRKFPTTFGTLELLVNEHAKFKTPSNTIDLLVQEVGIDNLIKLSLLSLRSNHFELLNANFFYSLSKSSLAPLFFSNFEKINIEIFLKSNVSLYDLGALASVTTIHSTGLLRKIVPLKKMSGSIENFREYAAGFAKCADASKSPVVIYSNFIQSLYDSTSLDQTFLHIAFAELTEDLESGKYLLNHVTHFYNHSVEDPKWAHAGDLLLGLLSTKHKNIGDLFIQSITIAYIKTLGKLESESSYIVVEKLLTYSIAPRIITESIIKIISLSIYTVQQRLNILFSLVVNYYPADGELGEIGRYALTHLLNSSLVAGITQEQLENIEDLVAGDDTIRLMVRDERWKRVIKKSLAEFISLVSFECHNKTEAELENIATVIARIWQPQNSDEVQTMLNLLRQENTILWNKIWVLLVSGKIETSFDVRVELTNDELIRLEKEIKRVEKLILWLSQGRLDATANKSLINEMIINLDKLDKAFEQLRNKLKPSVWSRIISSMQK